MSSGSSDESDGGFSRRRHKGRHHGRHHHRHHHGRKGERSQGKKRSRASSSSSSSSLGGGAGSYEESIRRAELEKLQNEVLLLKNQLREQKEKSSAAYAARAEKAAAAAAAKRARKQSVSKRAPLSFDTTPDPDRPVTEEDKRRISGNINRLPSERMLPLVSFVQDQIPPLSLAMPGHARLMPKMIEVDLDTLDNRTLRTVDHKVRQALALAGQARRRKERRQLEEQMHRQQQQRSHAGLALDNADKSFKIEMVAPPQPQQQVLTPQQTAMNLAKNLQCTCRAQPALAPLSPSLALAGGYSTPQDLSLPGTPAGLAHTRSDLAGHAATDLDDRSDADDDEGIGEDEAIPNLVSDSDSSSSSSSDDSDADDDLPVTYAPPPFIVPGAAAAPVSLSQAASLSSATTTTSATNPVPQPPPPSTLLSTAPPTTVQAPTTTVPPN